MTRFSIVLSCFLLLGLKVEAQDSVGVQEIAHRDVVMQTAWLTTLRTMAARGDSDHLSRAASEFLTDLGKVFTPGMGYKCCDFKTGYYMVLFTSMDGQGKPALMHILVHNPSPENSSLPGLKGPAKKLMEVFLADDITVNIQGSYDIERVENPATKQLGDFTTTIIGKIALPTSVHTVHNVISAMTNYTAMIKATGKQVPEPPAYQHAVTFSLVEFPHARAKLTGRHLVTVSQPIAHMKVVVGNTAQELRLHNWLDELTSSFDASTQAGVIDLKALAGRKVEIKCDDLISATSKMLISELDGEACKFSVVDHTECTKKLKAHLTERLKTAVEGPSCTADEARTVVSGFVPSISDSARLTSSTSLTNQPPQRFSFGLATGYVAGISTRNAEPRVQIQSGKIAANPFSRSLTMAVLNLPLWGYDPQTFQPASRERFRPFVGVPFAPYFGVAAGGSYLLTRTIAVNVGYARLWYDAPGPNEHLDQAPIDKAKPFQLGSTNAWFIAAGYNFGK
jgi:hypothetical protein